MKNEAEIVEMPRPLILRAMDWTPERVELLKRTITPKECTDDEFALFLEQCKHTGLNPFLRQAFMIERTINSKDARGNWTQVKRFEFQAAEIGMAARAQQFADFRGMKGAAVFEKDTFEMDHDAQTVIHKSSPGKERGRLLGAWAHAAREGHHIPLTWLDLSSRIQTNRDGKPNKFWATMPEGQIAKCARAEQYRLAYPQIFSGVYIQEEMPQKEEPPTAPEPPGRGKPKGRTAQVKEQLSRQLKPKGPPPAVAEAPALPAESAHVQVISVGSRAGAVISEMQPEELDEAIVERTFFLKKNPKHEKAAELTLELASLQAEQRRREPPDVLEGDVLPPEEDKGPEFV